MKKGLSLLCVCSFIHWFGSCSSKQEDKTTKLNEPSSAIELGELLFFDPILSQDSTISCASCHKPEYAFADNVMFSKGVRGQKGTRNTPSAMNLANHTFFFHDGRAESLEDQAAGPIENPIEMNLPITVLIERLKRHALYKSYFLKIYGKMPDRDLVLSAIAAYEKDLETSNTPFDLYMQGSDTTLFSESAKRGQIIFNEKAKCFDCHFGPDFTGDDFKNIGIFNGKTFNDSGRYLITRKAEDIGRFKVPGLRNVSLTAPYMHNGMFKTLKEVIEYYDQPSNFIADAINRDSLLSKPLNLNVQEKKDLEAFLLSLTDLQFKKLK